MSHPLTSQPLASQSRAPSASRDGGIALRDARPGDLDAVSAIEAQVFSDPWPHAAFVDLLAAPHAHIVVAEDGHAERDAARVAAPAGEAAPGAIVGYCVLLVAADEAEIGNIATSSAARRRGVGGLLLDEALHRAQHLGARTVYLEVRTSNYAARALYASRGFLPVGRRRAYYRNPLEDALVLRHDASRS